MPRAEVQAEVGDDSAALAVLRARTGWSTWMPGVVAVEEEDADHVVWRIETPVGATPVRLRFTDTAEGVEFEIDPAEQPGPFARVAGTLDVEGTTATFAFELEGTPPFPPAMVELLATTALANLAQRAVPPTTPARAESVRVDIPMSDGINLAALHFPAEVAPAPALLMVIPYRKEGAFLPVLAKRFVDAGYHVVIVDVRGTGGSVAEYEGLWSEREISDHVELIEWLAARPFCDGNVGLWGISYCGGNQLLAAARRPAALKCITPIVGMVDTYRDWVRRGGIPSHTLWGAGTFLNSGQSLTAHRGIAHYYDELVLSAFDDGAHRARSPETGLGDIQVPVLAIGGWHDYFLRATVRTFVGVNAPKRLVIGPWGHGDFDPMPELLPWFAHWLRGEGPDPSASPNVRVYRSGSEEWVERDGWPDPVATDWWTWQLGADREVTVRTHLGAVPMATNVRHQFVPDPTDSGMSLWGEDETWDSDPLPAELVVEGPVCLIADLEVPDCEDFDLHARVSVVAADGSCRQLTEGRLRASHRAVDESRSGRDRNGNVVVPWHAHRDRELVSPGARVELVVEINPMAHRFAAGDQVRLGITLVRADSRYEPGTARVLGSTRVLLPLA